MPVYQVGTNDGRTALNERPWSIYKIDFFFSKTFHANDFIMIDSTKLFHIFAFYFSVASVVITANQFCVHVRIFTFHWNNIEVIVENFI